MAFQKLYKVVVDSPIGFATINQLADNAADLRTQMFVQHGENDPETTTGHLGGGPVFDYRAIGRHDMDEIPRSVGYAGIYLKTSTPTYGVQFVWTGPGIPSIWHVGTGDYIVAVVGLSRFWAKVTADGGSTVTTLEPRVRPFSPTAANGYNAGLRINTFRLSAGDFVATNMGFSIALYGTP